LPRAGHRRAHRVRRAAHGLLRARGGRTARAPALHRGGASAMNRIRVPVVVGLTVIWSMLWGGLSPLSLVGGLLVSILIVLVFPFPAVNLDGTLRPVRLLVLIGRFLYDLVVASIHVAWAALRPSGAPKSAVI